MQSNAKQSRPSNSLCLSQHAREDGPPAGNGTTSLIGHAGALGRSPGRATPASSRTTAPHLQPHQVGGLGHQVRLGINELGAPRFLLLVEAKDDQRRRGGRSCGGRFGHSRSYGCCLDGGFRGANTGRLSLPRSNAARIDGKWKSSRSRKTVVAASVVGRSYPAGSGRARQEIARGAAVSRRPLRTCHHGPVSQVATTRIPARLSAVLLPRKYA
jgi:hypothetical protein